MKRHIKILQDSLVTDTSLLIKTLDELPSELSEEFYNIISTQLRLENAVHNLELEVA